MEKYIIDFNEDEINKLLYLASQITICPSSDAEQFCEQIKLLSKQIPKRIREHLFDFKISGSQSGFLLFRGIPTLSIPTPPNNMCKVGENTILSHVQAILNSVIGELIAYEAEGYGRLFQDVVPLLSMAKNQTSIGSNIELEIHTEQAFSRMRPDILSLACLKGDTEALTYILPVNEILTHMTVEELELLREPLWKTGVDLSFKLHGQEFAEGDVRGPMAIIYGPINDPQLVFDQDLMFSFNETGEHLLKKIISIYYEKRFQHNLKPGEIILIDNNRAVHGRSPFFPKYDGHDRFLVRCFGTFDYEKSKFARTGRMVKAICS